MKQVQLDKRIEEIRITLSLLNKKINILSLIRFILFILSLFCLLKGYFNDLFCYYIYSLLFFVLFIVIIRKHSSLKRKHIKKRNYLEVLLKHKKRRNGEWDTFEEDGREYLDKDCVLGMDLNLFGSHSLFQMVNCTLTEKGRNRLAQSFKEPSSLNIFRKQEAVKELSYKEDFVFQLESIGMNKDLDFLPSSQLKREKKKYSAFLFILSFCTLFSCFCFICGIQKEWAFLMGEIGFVLQLCISILLVYKHHNVFSSLCQINQSIQNYMELFHTLFEEPMSAPLLKDIKTNLFENYKAIEGLNSLSHICNKATYRKNIFAFCLLNGFLLFDFFLFNEYVNWCENYYDDFDRWFDEFSKIEVLQSLSVLKIDELAQIMPLIKESSTPILEFNNIKHPLISAKCIGNCFKNNQSLVVITGSNMSGKTTFLRTIGLNLILAYAGGFVFAESMTCSFMHIFSSIHIQDDLAEGISLFYGEILRIKKMVEASKNKEPMICLIDEIYNGTNAQDRLFGAQETLLQLKSNHILTFVTTHDNQLCNIKGVDNYHFVETYNQEKIIFDYILKEGPCPSSNGVFLLKQVGIITE